MKQSKNKGDGIIKSINLKAGRYTEIKLVDMVCTEAQKRSYYRKNKFANNKQREMFLERLSCYCTFEIDESNKYRIKTVFEFPKVAAETKIHNGIYRYLAPLILNNLLSNENGRSIVFSSNTLAADCSMVNQNYPVMKFNQEAVETDLNIPEKQVAEYFAKSDGSIDYYIRKCLKYLEATNCLVFNEVHLIKTYKEETESDPESNAIIKRRKYSDLHVASKEEMDLYTLLVEMATEETGVRNNCDKWYGKTAIQYRTELSKLLKKNRIKYVVKGFEVWKINTNRCRDILDSFSDKSIMEYQQGIGFILKSMIDSNAEQRKLQDSQLEHFKELSELTLLYDAPKVHLPSAKSYQERLQEEANQTPVIIVEQ